MAASAYAFLVSLNNTMDQIQLHPLLSACFDKFQFETLREKVDLLVDFVENHSHHEEGDLVVDAGEDLLSRIAVAAQKAEDLIEVEAADWIRDGSKEISSSCFLLDLQQKMEEMDRIINEDVVVKVKERKHPHPPPTSSMAPHPVPPSSERTKASSSSSSSSMVGFDGYLNRLLDELSGYNSSRQILPIVGMGGVGKTTLARNVYENPVMVEGFDLRVWITISQTFSVKYIFLQALSCVGESSSATTDGRELGEKLRKTLYGRRYLVVLDDMWSIEAWDKIKFYFPDTDNRSRIVVTTREQQLVDYFTSSAVAVDLLDEESSWKLFCDKTFGEEGGCVPPQVEAIGKKIVKKCKGLPLAIDLMGGLLRRSPRTHQYWKKIEQDKSLVLEYSGDESNNKPLSILYMSYKHLPVCYKPCFLYLGLFPEDHQIDVSRLIKFWVAEGFIKPKPNQTPEEVAESYVKELVNRNLLLAGALRLNKKFETCSLHDLVRELCIKIAEKENFYCVQRDLDGKRHFIVDRRNASSYPSKYRNAKFVSLYRPLLFEGKRAAPVRSRLLRVLVSSIKRRGQEVNLRLVSDLDYVHRSAISRTLYPSMLPTSISLLWRLQTLIFPGVVFTVLLSDIWKMPQLRHVEISAVRLPDPPRDVDLVALENLQLQTLKTVRNLDFCEEACKGLHNVRELDVKYISLGEVWESGRFNPQNIGSLHKLESLRCFWHLTAALKNLTLPNSLRELSLRGCLLPWSYMAIVGSLPHLQVLHLLKRAVVGESWNLDTDVRFLSLKYLQIRKCDDLVCWEEESFNFPVLETLSLEYMSKLEEVPFGIGDIPTLESVHLRHCSESANISAIKILEEQESIENLDLRLQLSFHRSEAEVWKGKVKELGITCQNLRIASTD